MVYNIVPASAESQKPSRHPKGKYLNLISNTQTLKNLAQTSSCIKTSFNNQKQVTLVEMN